MINRDSYTPLESLLLLTWIRIHGPDALEAAAFPRLSQDLINNSAVKQDPSYNAARLTPESLQELFLQLLAEDLKEDAATTTTQDLVAAADVSLSPNSRKRKRPGPPPPVTSLNEARQHVHRLPNAEAKLYAKYKQNVAENVFREQEELRQLEEEIQRFELEEKQPAEPPKPTSAAPSAVTSPAPVKEISRPSSAMQVPVANLPPKPPQPNGTGAHFLPPVPVQDGAPKSVGPPPPRQISPTGAPPASTPPQPLASLPPTLPHQYGPPPVKAHESPRPPSQPAPILQRPHGLQPLSPHPGPSSASTPPGDSSAQRTPVTSKPGTPSHHSQSPQLPVPSALKWEPPYQPHPGPPQQQQQQQQHNQQQRPPPHVAQFPSQPSSQHPQPWQPQLPMQYGHPPVHQPYPQGHAQQQPPPSSARPVLAAPQPSTSGPPLQPAPVRSHSGSPAPSQLPHGPVSPLPGQPFMPRSPFQHGQHAFPPPQSMPPNYMAPVSSTPPPLSPAHPAAQQWPQPSQQGPSSGVPPLHQQGPPNQALPPVTRPPAYNQPYPPPQRPAVPPHVVAPPASSTPGSGIRRPHPVLPHTPLTMPFTSRVPQGSGTKWRSAVPTPSTPGPTVGEVQSPAYEPLSPNLLHQAAKLPRPAKKHQTKPAENDAAAAKKASGAPSGARLGTEGGESSDQRRTSSVVSPREDSTHMDLDSVAKIKREDATPRPLDDAGDTTADESISGRRHVTSPRASRSSGKRKRQDSAMSDHRAVSEFRPQLPPLPPPGIPTHVLWTRAFPKVSASTLEQISSHKYANMFQNPIKPREAPGYYSIILRSTCLRSIKTAIHAGNKAAAAAAATLPEGDPGTNNVWLPISEDLVPPRAIINSAQLERELVHMFANAIMYNLDPNRGPGPAFLKGSGVGGRGANETHNHGHGHAGGDGANMIGYQVDQDSVVKDTQSMFAEVDKLLIELRSTEAPPEAPPLPPGAVPASERLARASFALASSSMAEQKGQTPASGAGGSFAEDEAEEHHTDREGEGAGGTVKRRRLGRG